MSEDKSEAEGEVEVDDEEQGTDVVIVKLGINVGDKFSSFKDFQTKLDENARANLVKFSKRDSRTIEAAKRKIKRHLRPELEFYQLRYACFFSLKNRPRGTGKRKRKSLTREFEVSCPASICVRATEDGAFLEVYNIVELHNHPVSESIYQRLLPKKRTTLEALFDGGDNAIEEEFIEGDKYRTVLKRCRYIARIASVSSTSRIADIIKNLDDYIFYLKYTTPKEEMERIKEERRAESNNNLKETIADESIQIIVEADNVLEK